MTEGEVKVLLTLEWRSKTSPSPRKSQTENYPRKTVLFTQRIPLPLYPLGWVEGCKGTTHNS